MALRSEMAGSLTSPFGRANCSPFEHASTPANSPVASLDFPDCMDFSEYGLEPMEINLLNSSLTSDCNMFNFLLDDGNCTLSSCEQSKTSRIPKLIKKDTSLNSNQRSLAKHPAFISRIPIMRKQMPCKSVGKKICYTIKPVPIQRPLNTKLIEDNELQNQQKVVLKSESVMKEPAISDWSHHNKVAFKPTNTETLKGANTQSIGLDMDKNIPSGSTAMHLDIPSVASALRLDDLDLDLLDSPVASNRVWSYPGEEPKHSACSIYEFNRFMHMRHIRQLEEKFDRACLQIIKLNRRIEQVQARCHYSVVQEQKTVPKPIKIFLDTMREARDAFLVYAQQVEEEISWLQSDDDDSDASI